MSNEVNKKSAPQRAVIDVQKSGSWGKVEYHHRLDCGHTETRKRIAPTPKIACTFCVLAEKMDDRVAVIQGRTVKMVDPMDAAEIIGDDLYGFSGEVDISRAQAVIAKRVGVPLEAVDVVSEIDEFGKLKISYAAIFLDSSVVYRLISGDN